MFHPVPVELHILEILTPHDKDSGSRKVDEMQHLLRAQAVVDGGVDQAYLECRVIKLVVLVAVHDQGRDGVTCLEAHVRQPVGEAVSLWLNSLQLNLVSSKTRASRSGVSLTYLLGMSPNIFITGFPYRKGPLAWRGTYQPCGTFRGNSLASIRAYISRSRSWG